MEFKWTKDKPKDEGWYWEWNQKQQFDPEIVCVRWYGKKLCKMNWEINNHSKWAGPIPMPKED